MTVDRCIKLFATITVILLSATHGALAVDNWMFERHAASSKIWEGPVTGIHSTGVDQWQGIWSNNQNQKRTLIINIYSGRKPVAKIREVESNQEWVAESCKQQGIVFVIQGLLAQSHGSYDFMAVLSLDQPSNVNPYFLGLADQIDC